jgi:hypothetical protein
MMYVPSGTTFRVLCIYPKKEILLDLTKKSEAKQDTNDLTYQVPSDGLLGAWSHDQFPKIVKKNESCSPAL